MTMAITKICLLQKTQQVKYTTETHTEVETHSDHSLIYPWGPVTVFIRIDPHARIDVHPAVSVVGDNVWISRSQWKCKRHTQNQPSTLINSHQNTVSRHFPWYFKQYLKYICSETCWKHVLQRPNAECWAFLMVCSTIGRHQMSLFNVLAEIR